jgi:DNA-binding Lrp family transcriptional regulator
MPKEKLVDLLYELMKSCKRSDRELARIIKVSQPTITRLRKNLENSGLIREYTVMPALERLGFEIVAFSFVWTSPLHETMKPIEDWVLENRRILFSSLGRGIEGKTFMIVSVHKDYTDFSQFGRELRSILGSKVVSVESFLISLKTDIVKHFSLKNLERV